MKVCKKNIAFLLALVIILPLLFIGYPSAMGENIPTIFINDEAWYKYQILPLIMLQDEPYIPISVFSVFGFIGVSYNEATHCYLIYSDNGKFISVNTEKGRYLTSEGEKGDIAIINDPRDIYISAFTAAKSLDLGIELTMFYDKDVVRLYSEVDIQPLEILIDFYIATPDAPSGGEITSGGVVNRREVCSAIADASKMKSNDVRALLAISKSEDITMTFAINSDFIKKQNNLSLIQAMAAGGHSFAISVDPDSDTSVFEQIEECNKLLLTLLKKKTLLVFGAKNKSDLNEKGYISIYSVQNVSEISDVKNVNFNRVKILYFDKMDIKNQSKFIALIDEARNDGKSVLAINQLTGK